MEEAGLGEAPRIGVFVCHCGTGISDIVNVPGVVEYAKELPDVVHVEGNLYYCSEEGRNDIKEAIKEHDLNKVVIAACTPKAYEPLFEATVEGAGLNKNLLQMANIREQCSWIHAQEPEEATEKAKDLVRMAVAKARVLEPQEELEIEVEPSTLVIGAGIAGMTSALCLANQGFRVYLVEKEPRMGGMLNRLHKLYLTDQTASEVLNPIVQDTNKHENISLFTSATVKDVRGYIGNFDVTVMRGKGEEVDFRVGTIIVATGAEVFEPLGMYGYGEYDGVITHLELERLMREGLLEKPDRVVMIQCVGSREDVGRTYCSRICCMTAIKNAALIKGMYPDTEVYILYRDLQTYGKENEEYHLRVRDQGVRFIEYTPEEPPEVAPDPSGRLRVRVYIPLLGEEIQIDSDLVVLSTPLVQHPAGKELSQILGVPLSSDGFFFDAHTKLRPVDFATDGIYVCGAAEGPKSVDESIAQAYAAASRAAIPMSAERMRIKPITAFINEERCVGCKLCVEFCPFEAHTILEGGIPRVIEALCQGCGTCAAACPERAITMRHFKDDQVLAEIKAAFFG
ncbi:MAG: CoB--CoM heterodisulfide reductase iron-sulfur subunit A family protein [Candidatus Bathyarchaeia archaeon]